MIKLHILELAFNRDTICTSIIMITVKRDYIDNHSDVQTQRRRILQLYATLRFIWLSVALTSRETSGEVNILCYKEVLKI